MDNDEKISLFLDKNSLQNGLFSEIDKGQKYDLETEYAKTRKNKSFKNYIIAAVTAIMIAGISYGITAYIDHKYSNIEVDIDVFEDLNLKKLLNMVSQVQNELSQARDEKRKLELDMANEINAVDLKLEAEKDLISKKRILKNEKKSQVAAAELNAENERKKIRSSYGAKISEVKARIEELEGELAKYESSNLEKAQDQQSALDSERQLFELEKQAQKKEYEATIENLRRKMEAQQRQAVIDQKRAVELAIREYQERIEILDPVVKGDNMISEGEYLHNIDAIASYIGAIPYENNLPEYVGAIRENAQALDGVVSEKNQQLEKIGSLANYFDRINEEKLVKMNVDGLVISKNGSEGDGYFVCYLTKENRAGFENASSDGKQIKAFVNFSDGTNASLLLEKAGEFFIGTCENSSDFVKINENAYLILTE